MLWFAPINACAVVNINRLFMVLCSPIIDFDSIWIIHKNGKLIWQFQTANHIFRQKIYTFLFIYIFKLLSMKTNYVNNNTASTICTMKKKLTILYCNTIRMRLTSLSPFETVPFQFDWNLIQKMGFLIDFQRAKVCVWKKLKYPSHNKKKIT